ncbi:MAG: hypothetical protein AAF654_07480 [Myxococcota bacterium]
MWTQIAVLSAALLVSTEETVREAIAAFEGLDYARAGRLSERALEDAELPRRARVEALRILAESRIIMGNADAADAPLNELFLLAPDFSLPPGRSPKIESSFEQMKKKVRARLRERERQELQRKLEQVRFDDLTEETFNGDSPIEFRLRVKDPGELIASVRVYYRGGRDSPYRPLALEPGVQEFWSTQLEPNTPRIEYFVDARDKADTRMIGLWSEAEPRVLVERETRSWTRNPWVWSGIGLGVAASVLAAVFVFNDSDEPDADLRFDL